MSVLDFALAAEELASVDINVPTTILATGATLLFIRGLQLPLAVFQFGEQ